MEDGLVRAKVTIEQTERTAVLILVVVEDGLVPAITFFASIGADISVLILVVVEDGLVL